MTIIILTFLSGSFALMQLCAFVFGYIERIDARNVNFALREGAEDTFAIFWHMWFAGFLVANKYCERFGGDYKEARKEKRVEFAESRMGIKEYR